MEIIFDGRGNLKPYQKIEVTLENFKIHFVDRFEKSDTRQDIFSQYKKLNEDFSNTITPNFVQWINGSYVTKKNSPKDLDLVVLIDHNIFDKHEKLIESKFRMGGIKNYFDKLDVYTIKLYPVNHKKHFITKFDSVYWNSWFSETRKNRFKQKFSKGYLEIKFGSYE